MLRAPAQATSIDPTVTRGLLTRTSFIAVATVGRMRTRHLWARKLRGGREQRGWQERERLHLSERAGGGIYIYVSCPRRCP